ncbi:MAG: VOC family protein [Nevskia sp.]|nr:VOC family protein [Nevskia sp.]
MNLPAQAPDAANAAAGAIVPSKFAHFVIRTANFAPMLAWYRKVFHMRTSFEAPVIAFLTYDDEHHRIALINTPHLPKPERLGTGVDHVAYSYASLPDLLNSYARLKGEGILPFWCINHGPTTSMYYRDPDGNEIEFQVDNYPTLAETTAYFHSAAFAANPIGVEYDPDVLLQKFRSGVPLAELHKQGVAPLPPGKGRDLSQLMPPPPGAQ